MYAATVRTEIFLGSQDKYNDRDYTTPTAHIPSTITNNKNTQQPELFKILLESHSRETISEAVTEDDECA